MLGNRGSYLSADRLGGGGGSRLGGYTSSSDSILSRSSVVEESTTQNNHGRLQNNRFSAKPNRLAELHRRLFSTVSLEHDIGGREVLPFFSYLFLVFEDQTRFFLDL